MLVRKTPFSLQASGEITVDFHTDGNGNYHESVEQYAGGIKIHCIGFITDPEAVYSLTIKSSGGGGGHWENVHLNEKLVFDLKTDFWHSTKISIDGHSSKPNTNGHAKISYHF